MADQIMSAVAPNIFERCVGAAGEHLGYIWNYKSNVAKLETQVNKLDDERADKSHAITLAENNAHKIRDGVKRWLGEAAKISKEATQALEDHRDKGKKRCLMGLCPNLVSRYQFSKRARKELAEIEEAITEAQRITQVSDPPVGQENTILSTEGCFTFDSRMSLLDDIIKALQDETNNLVGLYGLGGMGKTTLAKQVASHAAKETMFEEVVMASVTQKVDMKEMQGQIASMLGLKLSESTIAERASRIHERLKGKRVLVILDDLWKELDLKQVGIPFGAEHMGCKILLTSRFLPVLVSMGTKKEFSLVALNEEEAWKLFEEKATDVVKNPVFLTAGKKVANRCAGVPVLIVTVAASLSKRPQLSAWNDALEQLKKMNNKEMHDIVNSAIESISYKHLEKTHKRLFVLCGVIGGEASVEEVFQYGTGWGLFDDEVVTLKGARERLHSLILDLKDHCLLLDDHRRISIKMHDVVRDIAISIGKKDLSMFSIGDNDAQLNTWPMGDVLKRCTSIFVHGGPNLSCLPQQLECPKLEMCILNGISFGSNHSLTIPNTFFEKTGKLKVLDMSGLHFSVLPSSLSFLKNLQALRLHFCYNLKDISGVGELKKLQTLSIVGSGTEELPSGIGELSELRLLDVRHCFNLKVIPAGLIKGLSRLEELYVSSKFVGWEADECISGCVRNNASLVELKHLPNLCSLEIAVQDAKLLPDDLNFEKLERYDITVGGMLGCWPCVGPLSKGEITRKIRFKVGSTSINHWQHGIKNLFRRTKCLYIQDGKGIKNVSPELDENGFRELKHLCIIKDYEMQYIVNVEDGQHQTSFPSLESFHLSQLLKLQKICNGRLMKESFNNLTIMKVDNCNELKSLFPFSTATELRCLEEILVSACNALEGIVGENKEDGGVSEKIEFGQLHKLSLKSLPKLKNFISYGERLPAGHKSSTSDEKSEEIHVEEEELQSCVPLFEKVTFPKLKELELYEISNLTAICSYKLQEMPYCCLTRMTIQKCVRLKHIVAKEERETNIETSNFPQLSYLCLENLPNLFTFYRRSIEETDPCHNAMQPLFHEKVLFPKLEELVLSEISNVTEIWSHKLGETSCCNLTRLSIQKCDSLKYLLTPSICRGLGQLRILTIGSCAKMKSVVAKEKGETKIEEISFPKLSHLCLGNMVNLTTFYEEMDNPDIAIKPLFNEKVSFPKLEELKVSSISNLTNIWSHKLPEIPCGNLTKLEIVECKSLKYVLTPSVAMALVGLQNLTVQNCARMEHVVAKEEGETNMEMISFPQLIELCLKNVPLLATFYAGSKDSNECAMQALFNEKIQFPLLKQFRINNLESINILWQNPQLYQVNSFCKLAQITIESCASLVKMFSSTTHIDSKKDPQESLGFRNLRMVSFYRCKSLKHVFLVSVAHCLNKLEALGLVGCEVLETIIGDEESTQQVAATPTFLFPKLAKLELKWLPKLKCFYPREHTTKCPALKELQLVECGNMSVPDFLSFPEKQGDHEFEKVISGLKDLSIRSVDMIKIVRLYGHFPPHLFQSLEKLTITEFQGESVVFPSKFLSTIHNQLKTLRVVNCSFQEVFPYEGEVTSHANDDIFLPQLTTLRLQNLPELKSICKQDQYSPCILDILDKIRDLYVSECPHLTSLVSPSVSFRLLQCLTISNCSGLINVMQLSTARSLKQLMTLTIIGCEMIEEIVGGEVGDYGEQESSLDNDYEIIFSKLVCMQLYELPRLTSFCSSSDYTFGFPRLSSVTVIECPNMKTFSGGITTTPHLQEVYFDKDPTTCWENDLNTTVERKYTDMEAKGQDTTQIHETCKKVVAGRSKDSDKLVKVVDDNPDKGKGKQLQETPLPEQVVAISQPVLPSSSRSTKNLCNQVSEVQVRTLPASVPMTSSNYHFKAEAQIHVDEPIREGLICGQVTVEGGQEANIYEKGTGKESEISEEIVELRNESETWNQSEISPVLVTKGGTIIASSKHCENEIEPRKGTEIVEEEVICLNYRSQEQTIAGSMAACQPPEGISQSTATHVVEGATYTVSRTSSCNNSEAEACDKGKGKEIEDSMKAGETSNHSQVPSSQRATDLHVNKHFIPLLSEFLEIIQNQPLKSMSPQHVHFMEDAYRHLSTTNFSIDWFRPYVDKAREYLAVVEHKREVSELELEIAKAEADLEAMKEKKKALKEKHEVIASRIDLDKALLDN